MLNSVRLAKEGTYSMISIRSCVLSIALTHSFLLTTACGNSDNAQGNMTAGSSAIGGNNGGGSGGTSAIGTSLDAGEMTEYRACAALYAAMCKRMYTDCKIQTSSEEACLSSTRNFCPDLAFGSGSQVSIATAVACTSRWQQASCDDLTLSANRLRVAGRLVLAVAASAFRRQIWVKRAVLT
jgi:hypothetical protein